MMSHDSAAAAAPFVFFFFPVHFIPLVDKDRGNYGDGFPVLSVVLFGRSPPSPTVSSLL
jgi:hypothetical protein